MLLGLNAPELLDNYTEVEYDNGTYEVTVWWTKSDCAPDDVKYNITLIDTSSQEAVNIITKLTQRTIYLKLGVRYTVTISAELCDGDLTSEMSNMLVLDSPGTYESGMWYLYTCTLTWFH